MASAFKIEKIDPRTASEYLARNVCNRKVSKAAVRNYAAAMKRGEWLFNGETIKFDDEDRLIDGQHRLLAVVEAKKTVDFGVIRGLKHKAFQTIDTGRNRTGGDVLSTIGIEYGTAIAAACRLLAQYTSGHHKGSIRLTNTQLLELLDQHPDLPRRAGEVMKSPLLTKLIPQSASIFCYYLMTRVDVGKAQAFFRMLSSGRFDSIAADSIHALREKLIKVSMEYLKPPASVKIHWTILSWNAFYRRGAAPKLSREATSLPRFSPDPLGGVQ